MSETVKDMADIEIETLVYAENGFPMENRLEKVKETLEPIFEGLKQKYIDEFEDLIARGVKKAKLKTISAYTVKCEVYKALAQFKELDNKVANNLEPSQLMTIYIDFLDLVAWLNEYGDFIPTKQVFFAFSGISSTAYTYLMTDGDEEQKSVIFSIENFLVDMVTEAATSGIAKESTTKFRLQAKNAGHGIRTATLADDIIDKAKDIRSPAEYDRLLNSVVISELQAPKK